MKSTCPHCATSYRIDPRKVPEGGVFARCSRCGGVFEITASRGAETGATAPSSALDPVSNATIAPEPHAAAPDEAPAAEQPTPTGDDWRSIASAEPPEDLALEEERQEPLPELVSHRYEAPPEPAPAIEAEGQGALPELTSSADARTASTGHDHGIGAGSTVTPPAAAPVEQAATPPAPSPIFGKPDPHGKARRLARALVSDIAVYNPERRDRGRQEGTLRQEFRDEIRKSWEEYVGQVGESIARGTPYFREALNEILAGGQQVF